MDDSFVELCRKALDPQSFATFVTGYNNAFSPSDLFPIVFGKVLAFDARAGIEILKKLVEEGAGMRTYFLRFCLELRSKLANSPRQIVSTRGTNEYVSHPDLDEEEFLDLMKWFWENGASFLPLPSDPQGRDAFQWFQWFYEASLTEFDQHDRIPHHRRQQDRRQMVIEATKFSKRPERWHRAEEFLKTVVEREKREGVKKVDRKKHVVPPARTWQEEAKDLKTMIVENNERLASIEKAFTDRLKQVEKDSVNGDKIEKLSESITEIQEKHGLLESISRSISDSMSEIENRLKTDVETVSVRQKKLEEKLSEEDRSQEKQKSMTELKEKNEELENTVKSLADRLEEIDEKLLKEESSRIKALEEDNTQLRRALEQQDRTLDQQNRMIEQLEFKFKMLYDLFPRQNQQFVMSSHSVSSSQGLDGESKSALMQTNEAVGVIGKDASVTRKGVNHLLTEKE